MRADINHDKKLILVWKTAQEADLPIPDELEREINPLRQKKYKLIIMLPRFLPFKGKKIGADKPLLR